MTSNTTIELAPGISADPRIMVGKPCIAGTRITVEMVLRRLAEGYSMSELLSDYPHLTEHGVRSALAYAADRVACVPKSAA